MNSKIMLSVFLIVLFSGVLLAEGDSGGSSNQIVTNTQKAVCNIYNLVKSVLGAAVLLLIFLAAVVYAGGQVLGAETRARANVWATTMFLGAIFAVLLWLIVPWIIGTLLKAQPVSGDQVIPTNDGNLDFNTICPQ